MEMFANHGSGMNLVSKMQGDPSDIMSSFPDHCNKVNIEIRRVTQVFRLPSACNIHCVKSQRRDWCWSWSSNTLATWCEKSTYWKRPWCWERLKADEEGGSREWDGSLTSPTQWAWIRVSSRRQWRTGEPGMLSSMGSQSQGQLSNWTAQCI